MNKKIIIQIPFNVQGFNKVNELDEQWINYRLELFKEYTVKSLVNQTNQFFTAMLRVREETKGFITEELKGKLPDNIYVVGANYETLIYRCIENYNYLYLVRMDSDDCYDMEFIDILHNYIPKPDTEVLINQHCYSYDILQNRFAYYFYPSPPCYTLIYNTEDYKKGKRYHLKRGHGGAILLKHEILSGINFMSTIHEKNNSERKFGTYSLSKKMNWEEIKDKDNILKILQRFGVNK